MAKVSKDLHFKMYCMIILQSHIDKQQTLHASKVYAVNAQSHMLDI